MYSYPQYAANAIVAMPKPGKLPLNRFHLVKGPEYLHASLQITRQYHALLIYFPSSAVVQLTLVPMDRFLVCQLQLRKLWDRSP